MENPENPICNSCKKEWKPDETDIKKSGEVYKTCKDCRIRIKKYRKENLEKAKESQRKSRLKNLEKAKERERKWREENKCEHNKGYGFCKICNLSLYLVNKQRCNIYRILKSSSQNKTKSSIKYMGCDADYFIEYFKKKMDIYNETAEIKMNWDNIHIDHIKPVSVFNLDDEDELNKCCNYTNFQPLFAKDNLTKNSKWTDEDEVYWNENIKDKEYFGIYLPV